MHFNTRQRLDITLGNYTRFLAMRYQRYLCLYVMLHDLKELYILIVILSGQSISAVE